ncbi:hypothetical protein AZE42_05412 [Rhizopogon vesiculosus]|uniref:Uncharacterized protein n=1 Tax=Rhizopogon vesiculosus TaxID=180088 RepID=A0A1J8Q278_9AGAM|nr:hypothetical protein AZE42_05412 [Rhizopogon vesiculosus]
MDTSTIHLPMHLHNIFSRVLSRERSWCGPPKNGERQPWVSDLYELSYVVAPLAVAQRAPVLTKRYFLSTLEHIIYYLSYDLCSNLHVAPVSIYKTLVFIPHPVGQSFNAFAAFPLTFSPPQSVKDALLHAMGIAAIELVTLGVNVLVMSSITNNL